jgi:cell division protein FtsI/penicillin-binding protein 2
MAAIELVYLICGLVYRQIIQHKYFQQKENRQNSRRIVISGIHGHINDRNGMLLAGHGSILSIDLHFRELNDEFRKEYLPRANVLRQNNIKFNAKELRPKVRVDIVKKTSMPSMKRWGRTLQLPAVPSKNI